MAKTDLRGYSPKELVLGWPLQGWAAAEAACESPIEAQMMWALACEGEFRGDVRYPQNGMWILQAGEWVGHVHAQSVVTAGGSVYRLDFQIIVATGVEMGDLGNIAVECDGHDFHERTKEQAKRDRKRDRDLQARGFRVLRFTGSEIFRDAMACAATVWDHADQIGKGK
jgi:hypothetical protein